MVFKIDANGYTEHAKLLSRIIRERVDTTLCGEEMYIELKVDKEIGLKDSYVICGSENKWEIIGADERGLYYGIGKFLHSANWKDDGFAPKESGGIVSPDNSFRAIYFAIHFNNWYDEVSTAELEIYLDELLLYGHNAIMAIIPIVSVNSSEDEFFVRAVDKIRSVFSLAKARGMEVGILMPPNQGMKNAPKEWFADPSYEQNPKKIVRGSLGNNICPSIPEAHEYLRELWILQLDQFLETGLDYVITWPYDEGGCGCNKCRPWGAKGYCELAKEVHAEAKKRFPNSKFILSTWLYDSPEPEGEFEGLYQRLKTDLSFVDYILVDSHTDFPRYPLEHEVVKPIVNFPEISMWGLSSWGGRGANPLPKRFQRIWDSAKHVLSGGMPYSEGMYEDISKIQCVGYYWDASAHYRDILGQYIQYEYASDVVDEVLEMMELIEKNHVLVAEGNALDMDAVYRAEELVDFVNEKLSIRAKKAWRWRILYIRTKIDRIVSKICMEEYKGEAEAVKKSKYTPTEWLYHNEEAQGYMQELCKFYNCVDLREDRMNRYTLPPVKDGKVNR